MASGGVGLIESGAPCPKKAKADSVEEKDSECFVNRGPRFRKYDQAEEEYQRQYERFHYQCAKSQGFVIDWDTYDYPFAITPVAWARPFEDDRTNDELIHMLTLHAIDQHNKNEKKNLVFVEHVGASFQPCKGYNFWITFWAKDMSSPNTESKLYQTKVWRFRDEIEVDIFRLRPTDEEIAAVEVEPPLPLYFGPGKPPRVFT